MKRRMVAGLVAAGAAMQAPPALAIDSATCSGGSAPHAGRPFTLSAKTQPIVGSYRYAFDLDNDGVHETVTGIESSVRTERTTAGTFTYGVSVTDDDVPAGDPKREAHGTCDVTVVNDAPIGGIEAHPLAEPFPIAYEALRFTYTGTDTENDVNQVPMTHSIDFDGDGQFEFTSPRGDGEVFASFPAGFDKDVTHRVTDAAGASVDTKLHITARPNPFGFGGAAVLAPLGRGALGNVTPSAPRSVKRRTLLKRGVRATFSWGATWGHVRITPYLKHGRTKWTGQSFEGDTGYAPGQQLTIKPLDSDFRKLVKRGAKTLQLRWTAAGQEGPERKGTLVVRIAG
jgi:hypothetical protein